MSAMIGIRAARTILPSAAVESVSGHETPIRSAPASSQRRIWSIVATGSLVSVFVIAWPLIGAPPPTGPLSPLIARQFRRAITPKGRRPRVEDHQVGKE